MCCDQLSQNRPPVAIGGVGGSGTRVAALCMRILGYHLGCDLNEPLDNLWFTLLFKRREVLQDSFAHFSQDFELFRDAMTTPTRVDTSRHTRLHALAHDSRLFHDRGWLKKRAATLCRPRRACSTDLWGWKEPNTHIVLDRLRLCEPRLKYIHVARNGLDMAYSSNQQQLELWGPPFLGPQCKLTPRWALQYWCWAHQRVLHLASDMGRDFHWLNFDALCKDPRTELVNLMRFLDASPTSTQMDRMLATVSTPRSTGRFRDGDASTLRAKDIAFVRTLGFDVA